MQSNLHKLIEHAKVHDESAITELYELTQQPIYSAIQRLLKNHDDAQDILQDAYISAFTHLDMLKDAEKFQPWLYRIAMNRCKDYFKKKKPILFTDLRSENEYEVDFEDDRSTFSPEQQLDYSDTIKIFDQIFDSIPEDQRLCILMFYREEMSISEIAETLNVSEGTIKSRLNYGRKKIRVEVQTMEKKGVKLYGAMPFLAWMLRKQAMEVTVSISDRAIEGILTTMKSATPNAVVDCTSTDSSAVSNSISQGTIETAVRQIPLATAKASVSQGSKPIVMGIYSLATKLARSSISTKIIAGVLAATLVLGSGAVIRNLIKDKPQVVSQSEGEMLIQNSKWEELLGKTKEEVIKIFGQPENEKNGDIYYQNKSIKIHVKDNIAVKVTCNDRNYSVKGIKEKDSLEHVKSIFGSIIGATLDGENVDCGDLTAIFYRIENYSYQFLYDKNEIVQMISISLIQSEEYISEPSEDTMTSDQASNSLVDVPTKTTKPDTTDKTSETDWKKAYKEFITKDLYAEYPKLWYIFADIDGNGILELFTLVNTSQIQIDDGRAPTYEHGAEITMYCYNGSEVVPVNTFYFGNSAGRFVFDYNNHIIWHESSNTSQGNIIKVFGYMFSNGALTTAKSVKYDSTVFAYKGGENESDIIYEPSEQEYEKVYESLKQFPGINWYFVTDDVLQAIKSYEEYFN